MSQMFNPRRARGIVAVRADAGGDPKAIFAALQGAFETFKAEHAEEVKALKKGQEDVVKAEKVDRINDEVGKLQAALDKAVADIAAVRVGSGGSEAALRDPAYSATFDSWVRGARQDYEVQASLKKDPNTDGGFLAPVEWDRTITDALVQVSQMRQIAQVQSISGNGYTKLFNARGFGSGWVGETSARPETATGVLAPLTFGTGEIYANPAASQQLLDDAEVDIEAWIANEVQTEFAKQEGIAFLAGDGVNKPNGLLTYAPTAVNAAKHPWGAVPTRVVAGAAAITPDEIVDMAYDLPGEYEGAARWLMNRKTLSIVRKMKDGDGNFLWQPSYQLGEPASLLGFPITDMVGMPDVAASAIPLAFGDFGRGYLVIDRIGVRVLRDPYTQKPFVLFYTTKRVGGGVQDPTVMRFLRMAAA